VEETAPGATAHLQCPGFITSLTLRPGGEWNIYNNFAMEVPKVK
jgi:hypothetical protein